MIVDDLRAFAKECPDGAAVILMRDAAEIIENMQKRKLIGTPSVFDTDQALLERVHNAILNAMDITDGLDSPSALKYAEAAIKELRTCGAMKVR